MFRVIVALLLLLLAVPMHAQRNFQFSSRKSKTVIPFRLINNLVIIPVKLNGVSLNFLLDTGVEETILFSLEETDDLTFENVVKIKLRGLGQQESIEGLKSTKNRLELKDLHDDSHDIYIVLDQDFNFSSHIGIPVNGIIGYQFFRDNLVEINYGRKRITVYKDAEKARAKFARTFARMPLSVEFKKPYVLAEIDQDGEKIPAKLLVDVGSSDAVWLFTERSESIRKPQKYFEDFLGRGFSGEVRGLRGRIKGFRLGDFAFEGPIAAFPDSVSIRYVNMVKDRIGSVGGEIWKRFTIVLDYGQKQLFLKKNNNFSEPFHYNMSGLEIEHAGLQWVKETVELPTESARMGMEVDINGAKANEFRYKFELKPVYTVTSVRSGSPAEEGGLQKGDVIRVINGRNSYRYTLEEISRLLRSEPGREIRMEVERDGKPVKVRFTLRQML